MKLNFSAFFNAALSGVTSFFLSVIHQMQVKGTPVALAVIFCPTCFLFISTPSISHGSELTLAIANSTCVTMKKVGQIFTERTGTQLKLLCQPSGLLAQGIIEGALDADYFISANESEMNKVVRSGHIDSADVRKDWGTRLVVASLPLKEGELKLQTLAELNRAEVKQILVGDPSIAPYGVYAREALVSAGLWDELQPKLKYNKKISMSLRTLKKYGLSRTGIVALLYQANVKNNVLTHFVVPQHFYSPIYYYSAPLLKNKNKEELAQFLLFVRSKEVNEIFKSSGFVLHPPAP